MIRSLFCIVDNAIIYFIFLLYLNYSSFHVFIQPQHPTDIIHVVLLKHFIPNYCYHFQQSFALLSRFGFHYHVRSFKWLEKCIILSKRQSYLVKTIDKKEIHTNQSDCLFAVSISWSFSSDFFTYLNILKLFYQSYIKLYEIQVEDAFYIEFSWSFSCLTPAILIKI